ncbi:hypothetical protein [Streptomyces sp. NPDC001139]
MAMLAGLTAVTHGLLKSNAAHSIGGSCVAFLAFGVIFLINLRGWIVDTSDERRILGSATRAAQDERTRYIAAQAALENEQGRLNRDMATERRRIAAQLIAEREALRAEFEEKRATLITETMEATFRMISSGKLTAPEDTSHGRLIPFPQQHSEPARERSREHGVVSP